MKFDAAPRFLGVDESGREVLSFVRGDVPAELHARHADGVLAAAAQLIRRYHDAVAGSRLAAGDEVVCHNDLSPCNAVFRGGVPCALIDFDGAAPGPRARDLAYALFLWLNIGTDGPPVGEQARRMRVFCAAYGVEPRSDELLARMLALTEAKAEHRREGPDGWWRAQHAWLQAHGAALA